jgi:hypothetical protein
MIGASFFSLGFTTMGFALSAGYLLLVAYAIIAQRTEISAVPLVLGMYALGLAGYVASAELSSVLTFATCWLINAASCAGAFLVPRRSIPLVVVPEVVISACLLVALPQWKLDLPLTILVTQTTILIVIRVGLRGLFRFGQQTDDETASAERATRDLGMVQSASRKIAEDARILHDTAINTLGAIANGGAGVADRDQVREQCARDVAQLEALRSSNNRTDMGRPSLRSLFGIPGLPIRRVGLDDGEIEQLEGFLADTVISALVGAAGEAVKNAAKHSGADRVSIGLAREGATLRLIIGDDGRGFDGGYPSERGLANSIFARAHDNGIEAALETLPGKGTEVTLSVPIPAVPVATSDRGATLALPSADVAIDVEDAVAGFHERAASLWGAGVTVVSIVLTIMGGIDGFLILGPMIAVMVASWMAARIARSRSSRTGPWAMALTAALVAGAPVVFTLSAAAVGFGSDAAVHWQALAATGPFVLFLSLRPPRGLFLAVGAWLVVIVSLAVGTLGRDANGAAIVVVAGCVGAGFSLAWNQFQNIIARVGDRAAGAQRQTFEARLMSDMQTAAQATYTRWLDAGLEEAISLLRRIASAELSPDAEETRLACDGEEEYLRQLILVSPELIHLGHGVMPAIAAARARGVHFTVRLGDSDAASESTADEVSALMLGAIAASPRESSLTATVFPVQDGLQVTLLGLYPYLEAISREVAESSGAQVHHERFGSQELLQLKFNQPEAQPVEDFALVS